MQHLRHSTDLTVDHLYQTVFQGLAISINRNDVPDDRTAPHILPGSQLGTYCLYLSIGGSVLYPNIKGMFIANHILHHLKGSGIPLGFEHHLIFPFPCPISCQVLGASGSPLFHQVAYVTPDCPHRRTLPALPFCFHFQCIIQHFPCSKVLAERPAEPHRRNISFLFLRKRWEVIFNPRLPAQAQHLKIIPAVPVLLLQPSRPCLGFHDIPHIPVEGSLGYPQRRRKLACISSLFTLIIINKALQLVRQLHSFIEFTLVAFDVRI